MQTSLDVLADIRAATDRLERLLSEPRPVPTELVAASPAGVDVLAIPFYFVENQQRAEVTRRVLRHFRNVAEEIDAVVIGVGSEGDTSRNLWGEVFDLATYSEYPQNWRSIGAAGHPLLRLKFDETLRRAMIYNPSRVFIGGSDDIIPVEWFKRAFKSDADLFGVVGGAHIVRYDGGSHLEMWDWDGKYPGHSDIGFCGGGFVISRRLLDQWNWAPFSQAADEIGVERRARRDPSLVVDAFDAPFFAIKVPGAVLNDPRMATRYGAGYSGAGPREEFDRVWKALAQ